MMKKTKCKKSVSSTKGGMKVGSPTTMMAARKKITAGGKTMIHVKRAY